MIPLGSVSLNNEDSIHNIRKKILQAIKLLNGDSILAVRIAGITSQIGRSLCKSSSESRLNIGLFRGIGGVAFCVIFMTRESYFQERFSEISLMKSFFDEINYLMPHENWHRLLAIVWLDYSNLPPDSLLEKVRNVIKEKNRHELMFELQEKNQNLSLLKERLSSLNTQLEQENLRMGADLDLLKQMQQLILPKPNELQNIKDLDIAGFMEPADEMGGDYYDVLYTDEVVTIAIGDVTGHGLESGILMVMTQTAVRTLKEIDEKDPVRFLDTLNQAIYDNIQPMESEKNLTLAILNYYDHKISISGQHEEIKVVIFVTNSLNTQQLSKLKDFIKELSENDPDDLYILQLERSEENEEEGSGLGLITMINDFNVKLGWKFEAFADNDQVMTVTTMAQVPL